MNPEEYIAARLLAEGYMPGDIDPPDLESDLLSLLKNMRLLVKHKQDNDGEGALWRGVVDFLEADVFIDVERVWEIMERDEHEHRRESIAPQLLKVVHTKDGPEPY